MAWNFELVAGPCKGRTGGLAWDGKAMLFSAVAEERILRYDPASGKTETFRRWTGRTNGIALAKDGTVFGAQEGGRRVIHFLGDGSTAPTQELLDGAHHNQLVDVAVDSRGRVWIADPYNAQPPYGPPAYPFLPHASVLRLDNVGPRLWRLERITHDTLGPRAVMLSADEKTLYVADGDVERGDVCQLFAYPLNAHGSVGHRRALLTFAPNERGIESMCLDSEGNIVACAQAGRKAARGRRSSWSRPGARYWRRTPRPATCRCAARSAMQTSPTCMSRQATAGCTGRKA
jgi:gluconolactonase